MPACPPENQLQDLIEGRASEKVVNTLIDHLEGCPSCRAIVALLTPQLSEQQPSPPALEATALPPTGEGPLSETLGAGQHVGPYRLVRLLGTGGMGMVYEAVHERIGSRAAIKILLPRYARDTTTAERFLTEARAANAVQHPGLVHVFEMGQLPSGAAYIVMEYLVGESLGSRLRRTGKLPPHAAVTLARQIADALEATHSQGVIHRDLKPDNIMLVPDPVAPAGERAKILDFGLAKLAPAKGDKPAFTQSGTIMGTPLYMSPEQCRGAGRVDAQADVYSLGVVLYHLLTGHPPFSAFSVGEVMAMHLRDQPPPLGSEVPAGLGRLLTAMLAKDPAARPSMREVAARLDAPALLESGTDLPKAQERPRPRRRWALWPAGTAALALLALLALWTHRGWRRGAPVVPPPTQRIFIPGGVFLMGSTADEIDAAIRSCGPTCRRDQFEREQPVRQVGVSPFYLDRTEVTAEQFAAWLNTRAGVVMDDSERVVREGRALLAVLDPATEIVATQGRFTAVPGHEHRPVRWVTWRAALAYCTDHLQRLPTEAEWEYAARGAQGWRYPWGNDEPACAGVVFARHQDLACARMSEGPEDVGVAAQDRSPQGVQDLAGNVAEWVMDGFAEHYAACPPPCTDPVAAKGAGGQRVMRGGDWLLPAEECRAAFRSRAPESTTAANVGFRCAAAAGQ